jgi:hypothetical protein
MHPVTVATMSPAAPARCAPAFACPPTLRFGPISAWLTDPAGALVQFQQSARGTVELANWLVGPAFDRLDAAFPGGDGLVFVFDMSLMLGRSAAARWIVLKKVREAGSRFSRVVLIPPLVAPPMYLQSMRFTFTLLRNLGIPCEFADSSASAIDRLGLRVSAPASAPLASAQGERQR